MLSLIKAAKIVAAHGIRGQVKLKPMMPELPDVPLLTKEGTPYPITIRGTSGDVLIADVKGMTDRNAAEAAKGTELYIAAEALPGLADNEFYVSELTGLAVKNAHGATIGRIAAVHDFGAGDVVEIAFSEGVTEMFPFRNAIFPQVDIPQGFVTFDPPEVTE